MRFVRFVVSRIDPDSAVADGPFALAYELRDSAHVDAPDREQLAEHLVWFEKNLKTPARFNRTKSAGFYHRKTRGVSWFKHTAAEHLTRMHRIATLLEQYGHSVAMVSESRVGYVVYEDAFQVVAEPFSDTRTR